jgi:hypothetical protein
MGGGSDLEGGVERVYGGYVAGGAVEKDDGLWRLFDEERLAVGWNRT